MDNVPEDTRVVSVMNQRLETNARLRYERGSSPLPYLIRRQRQTDNRGVSSSDNRNRIPCRFINGKTRHVIFDIYPSLKLSLRQDADMVSDVTFDMLRQREKPNKKSKKGGAKKSVA